MERAVLRLVNEAAMVRSVGCRASLEEVTAHGRWPGRVGVAYRYRLRLTQFGGGNSTGRIADHQSGERRQVWHVTLIVGVVCGHDDAATGDLAAEVEQDVELRGGGLEVSCREGNRGS